MFPFRRAADPSDKKKVVPDMRRTLFLLAIIAGGITSCSKKNQASEIPAIDHIDTSSAVTKYSGLFSSAPNESVSGKALILQQNGIWSVALENINIKNGPDLHLYISEQITPVNFIDLGNIKSTKGNQVYPLTFDPDFKQYKYILIYCQQYDVLFGSAELK
jgi:Electron transfer DM13